MLVTFNTKAWSNITLFGDVAIQLLKMTGHSGTVPGALRAADIPAAISRLQQALAAVPEDKSTQNRSSNKDDPDEPPPVSLRQRALPLIELLSAAAAQKCDVMWEAGAPVV